MSSAVASARKPATTGTPLALVSAATGAHKRPSPGVGASFRARGKRPLFSTVWRGESLVQSTQFSCAPPPASSA